MKIKSEYEPLVLVGAWNKAMFTPDWVQKYVFPGSQVTMEFPINNPLASIRYTSGNIVFSTIDSRLSFLAKETKKELFDTIGSLAKDLCRYLQHTPIQNYGINHVFELTREEVAEKEDFQCLFKSPFDERPVSSGSFVRSIPLNDCTLNFNILSRPDGFFEANFNYHYTCNSIEDLIKSFEPESVNTRLIEAKELLQNSYGFQVIE